MHVNASVASAPHVEMKYESFVVLSAIGRYLTQNEWSMSTQFSTLFQCSAKNGKNERILRAPININQTLTEFG